MEIKIYQPQFLEAIQSIQLSEEDARFTKTPLENLESAKANENRHPTLVMEGKSVSRSSLYMKEMDQRHILLIQKRFSLDHLLLMHVTEVKV